MIVQYFFYLSFLCNKVLGFVDLEKRDEGFLPLIANDFPHFKTPEERVLKWMDKEADPCSDFYKYSCGGFTREFDQKAKSHTDVLALMQQSNSLLMEQILSQKETHSSSNRDDNLNFQKLKRYYNSCLDVEKINERGFEPIIPLAKHLSEMSENRFPLTRMTAELITRSIKPLFNVAYGKVEGLDMDEMRLSFTPPVAFTLPDTEGIKAVLTMFINHNALTFKQGKNIENVASWISKFEHSLVQFIDLLDASNENWSNNIKNGISNPELKTMTLADLNEETGLDWAEFTSKLGLGSSSTTKLYFYGSQELFVSYLNTLVSFCPEDLEYFNLWRLGMSHFNKLSRDPYDLYSRYFHFMKKSVIDESTDVFQVDCVTEIGTFLNYLSGSVFVRYSFNETQKADATKLVDNLFASFNETFTNTLWMDIPTRTEAIKKLENMSKVVGYPNWLNDSEQVYHHHESLDFASSYYFENAVNAQVFAETYGNNYQYNKEAEQLLAYRLTGSTGAHTATAREDLFFGYPWQLNAFHIQNIVQIQINNGILQRPLYSLRNRASMNYGSLGMVIGHEICHGFDSIGNQYDSTGARTSSWWTEFASSRFDSQSRCFEEQYSKFNSSELTDIEHDAQPVDGKLTLAENIADNGGLNAAYHAWKKETDGKQTDVPLKEFGGLTDEQLFFVSFGQTWCQNSNSVENIKNLLKDDDHAPNAFRVRGVLQNSQEWEKAFNCPATSLKCEMYG